MKNIKIEILAQNKLRAPQLKEIQALQKLCFPNVDKKEAAEDFYNPEVAHVLAYVDKQLAGWTGIHKSRVVFEGKKIKLGGFGLCVHPNWRKQGLGTLIAKKAISFLRKEKCQLAFLSIDLTNKNAENFYKKLGFIKLPGNFSWKDIHGKIKKSPGGMILPLCSPEIFKHVLSGKRPFYIGEGYW